jgi:hypothetical protein
MNRKVPRRKWRFTIIRTYCHTLQVKRKAVPVHAVKACREVVEYYHPFVTLIYSAGKELPVDYEAGKVLETDRQPDISVQQFMKPN